tara:strand:+ start:114 stop:359 length:246 start_codon:yes stop_codon:yes gene_type:complete
MRYTVMFQVEEGEWMYASAENPFTYSSPALSFTTREEALVEAGKYNTGIVVEREGNIREFNREERLRAKMRDILNGVKHGY